MLNSRNPLDLVPEAQKKLQAAKDRWTDAGLQVVVASTLRDLESQAALFRMNRTRAQIQKKVDSLRARGFDFLADVINRVGPQPDDDQGIRTNAGPGESWHNYGRAFDGYPLVNGKLAGASDPVWAKYGAAVEGVGLVWAGRWTTFREMPHAQLDTGGNPLRVLGPLEIRQALKAWL